MHSCTVACSISREIDRRRQHTSADVQTLGKRVGVQSDVCVDKAAIADSVTGITVPVWAIELPVEGM